MIFRDDTWFPMYGLLPLWYGQPRNHGCPLVFVMSMYGALELGAFECVTCLFCLAAFLCTSLLHCPSQAAVESVPKQVAQPTAGTPRYARGVLDNWLHYFIRKRGFAFPEGVSSGADIWAMYAEYTVGRTAVLQYLVNHSVVCVDLCVRRTAFALPLADPVPM